MRVKEVVDLGRPGPATTETELIPAFRNRFTVRSRRDSPKISKEAMEPLLLALRPLYARSVADAVKGAIRSSITRTALACTVCSPQIKLGTHSPTLVPAWGWNPY